MSLVGIGLKLSVLQDSQGVCLLRLDKLVIILCHKVLTHTQLNTVSLCDFTVMETVTMPVCNTSSMHSWASVLRRAFSLALFRRKAVPICIHQWATSRRDLNTSSWSSSPRQHQNTTRIMFYSQL